MHAEGRKQPSVCRFFALGVSEHFRKPSDAADVHSHLNDANCWHFPSVSRSLCEQWLRRRHQLFQSFTRGACLNKIPFASGNDFH